jgi:hypothetical protein
MPQTATSAHPYPDVQLPPGAHTLSTWADWDGLYRLVWGDSVLLKDTSIVLSTSAPQLPDGSADTAGVVADEVTAILIGEIRDGASYDCLSGSVQGARNLAQALKTAAHEIKGWTR